MPLPKRDIQRTPLTTRGSGTDVRKTLVLPSTLAALCTAAFLLRLAVGLRFVSRVVVNGADAKALFRLVGTVEEAVRGPVFLTKDVSVRDAPVNVKGTFPRSEILYQGRRKWSQFERRQIPTLKSKCIDCGGFSVMTGRGGSHRAKVVSVAACV